MFVAPSLLACFLFLSLHLPTLVRANCECGYTVNSTLYTDLLETDFLHLTNITNDTDWLPQKYQITPALARGPFGKDASPSNVVPNPLANKYDWAGNGIHGGDAGLQLIVKGGTPPQGGMIPMAEIVSNRTDFLYGSFRVGMRMTAINGTCGAFFWYFNDTQEIDMEFLSAEYNSSSHPVNLVLQSPESVRNGFDAASTGTFDINQLPFNPSDGFHEYRFDWSPTAVVFYADGVAIKTMTKAIPTSPGHITLSHWSNGDPAWSGGPPETDAIVTVEYVKGYFNSSDTQRQSDWAHRCSNVAAPNATCAVPELKAAPNGNQSADTFFFTQQKNMTNNQTGSGLTSLASSTKGSALWYLQGATTVSVLFMAMRLFDWCL